ncbi:hypothetical protein NQ318_001272 [Aromia moschata]|uniref:Uncharacterized protein n=1 Tax=Aromia moschata TaxID=1265417 RepID=A0AAV8ZHU0_9CUCU|nr:hypothetical protein NQ318_001272 [Aromia moschata]
MILKDLSQQTSYPSYRLKPNSDSRVSRMRKPCFELSLVKVITIKFIYLILTIEISYKRSEIALAP